MIKDPIHPVIQSTVTWIAHSEFGLSPKRAAEFAAQFIEALHRRDLDIIRGSWMQGTATREITWENLLDATESLQAQRGGIKPWLPPELETPSSTSGKS